MVEGKGGGKKGPDKLIPLTPDLTKGVVKGLEKKGATLFDWEKFQKFTEHLPPDTRIADILAAWRKQNPPK